MNVCVRAHGCLCVFGEGQGGQIGTGLREMVNFPWERSLVCLSRRRTLPPPITYPHQQPEPSLHPFQMEVLRTGRPPQARLAQARLDSAMTSRPQKHLAVYPPPLSLPQNPKGKREGKGHEEDWRSRHLAWGGPWSPDSQQATDTVERSLVGIPALLLATLHSKLWNLSKPSFPYLQSVVGKT